MKEQSSLKEYLIISRGQWDKDAEPEKIQKAIDAFYAWIDQLVREGKMKHGQRLGIEGKMVSKKPAITDGPFGEAKEAVGGYWFIVANSLEEEAKLAMGNPCLECGLFYEIRPIESVKASAFAVTNETPNERS